MATISIPARRERAARKTASKTPLLDKLAQTKPVRAMPAPDSPIEAALLLQIRADGLPEPEREVRFHAARRWRLDFGYSAARIGIECEGATWAKGRHTRGSGYEADCEKYSEAALLGWLVIRATRKQVEDGTALGWIRRALAARATMASGATMPALAASLARA